MNKELIITLAILGIFIGTLFGYYVLGGNNDFPDKLDEKYCDLWKDNITFEARNQDGELIIVNAHPVGNNLYIVMVENNE